MRRRGAAFLIATEERLGMMASPRALSDLADAAERTARIAESFRVHGLAVPQIAIVNPPLWEFGHIGWFAEFWLLRTLEGRPPLQAGGDRLYDSAAVAHATRWSLDLPGFEATAAYVGDVARRVAEVREHRDDEPARYFEALATFHEDMHGEAAFMTSQTLGRPWPLPNSEPPPAGGPLAGDLEIAAGRYRLGAERDGRFAFDNEKWAHDVDIAAFAIARAPVTNAEYAAYVERGGPPPRDWVRAADGTYARRWFGEIVPLRPHAPVVNVSRDEAQAFCRAAGRRLPTETEWEIAATYDPRTGSKRRFPWGDDDPQPKHANLDARYAGAADVGAFPAGDTPHGLRQMIGNVWEWTASDFLPYPDFVRDPYKEYSAPWFGNHAVLRGGSFVTRARLLRGTWRNFYQPHRADAFAGFRTCACS